MLKLSLPLLHEELPFHKRESFFLFPNRQSCNVPRHILAKFHLDLAGRQQKISNSNFFCFHFFDHFYRAPDSLFFFRFEFRRNLIRKHLSISILKRLRRQLEFSKVQCHCRPCRRCSRDAERQK